MRKVLITGASGTLGRAFGRICDDRDLEHHLASRDELDIASEDSVARALERYEPWLVINAAGYVRVDEAELDPARCFRENVVGPQVLARRCPGAAAQLVAFSSDLVFDGRTDTPYVEHDRPSPLGVYGRAKHEAELRVQGADPRALIIRTSAFFGPWDHHNFVTSVLRDLREGRAVRVASDAVVSPTYVPDLVHATLDLAIDGEAGVWHLANVGATTWCELAVAAARLIGYPADRVIGVPSCELFQRAVRPAFSALASTRGTLLSNLDSALRRYCDTTRNEHS